MRVNQKSEVAGGTAKQRPESRYIYYDMIFLWTFFTTRPIFKIVFTLIWYIVIMKSITVKPLFIPPNLFNEFSAHMTESVQQFAGHGKVSVVEKTQNTWKDFRNPLGENLVQVYALENFLYPPCARYVSILRSVCNVAALKQQLWCSETDHLLLCLCATGEKCGALCTTEQFTCANGCCLDPGLECDLTPQCSDGSDEQKCEDCKQWLCKLGFVFAQAHGIRSAAIIWHWWDVSLKDTLTWIMFSVPISEQQVWNSAADSSEWTKRWLEVLIFLFFSLLILRWFALCKIWHSMIVVTLILL